MSDNSDDDDSEEEETNDIAQKFEKVKVAVAEKHQEGHAQKRGGKREEALVDDVKILLKLNKFQDGSLISLGSFCVVRSSKISNFLLC